MPPCAVYHQNQGVGISASTGYTGPEAYGLMTGWTYPNWMSNDVLLRSFSGAIMTDDAVFTRVAPGLGDRELDPWFFDDQQGFGVDDVELSRDLQTIVGIAGGSDEKLRVYRTTVHPYGAPNWNHQPFYTGNQPVAQRCYELDGKFESTSLAPSGQALAYGTAEGIHVASIPGGCAPGDRGALVIPRRALPRLGPGRRSRRERCRRIRQWRPGRRQAGRGGAAEAHAQARQAPRGHAHHGRTGQGHGDRQAQGPHARLRARNGQGLGQADAADQAQEGARQGDREGQLQARRRRRDPDHHGQGHAAPVEPRP